MTLSELMDASETYIQTVPPAQDILITIGVHLNIFIELLRRVPCTNAELCARPWGIHSWISTAFLNKINKFCKKQRAYNTYLHDLFVRC